MRKIALILALFCLASSCKKEEFTEGKQTVEHLKKVIEENDVKRLVPVTSGDIKPSSIFREEGEKYHFINDRFLSVHDSYRYITYNLSFLVKYQVDDVGISGDFGSTSGIEKALFLYFSH